MPWLTWNLQSSPSSLGAGLLAHTTTPGPEDIFKYSAHVSVCGSTYADYDDLYMQISKWHVI